MDRRAFLSGAFGVAALAPREAGATTGADRVDPPFTLRGSIDAASRSLRPNDSDNQSRALEAILEEAAADNKAVFLPPGRYVVADIVLPPSTRLTGVAGATELVFAGGAHLLATEGADTVALSGLVLNGGGLPLADYVPGLIHIAATRSVVIEACHVRGSAKAGLALDRTAGYVDRSLVTDCAEAGIRTIESTGLSIAGNRIADCGDGILVWRWSEGEDGTLLAGNRIERIGKGRGGGSGIDIFRAHGVQVGGNRIVDCAAAAIRVRSTDGVQITGNTCRGASGNGIVVSDDAAALIAGNVVDGFARGISAPSTGERASVVANNLIRDATGEG